MEYIFLRGEESSTVRSIHLMTLIRPPVWLIQEVFQFASNFSDALPAVLQPSPSGCDAPAL